MCGLDEEEGGDEEEEGGVGERGKNLVPLIPVAVCQVGFLFGKVDRPEAGREAEADEHGVESVGHQTWRRWRWGVKGGWRWRAETVCWDGGKRS